ncbi:MAG: HD domain-containing protein, partial [Gammaproteobacteria bacterium]|nr:HD domain-containing protein [Gammaproteobacteria bacterium]
PYNGQVDLQKKTLRHVSLAFSEDPVRILRLARFAASFNRLGFAVSEDTNKLMHAMVSAGEVDALVPERVWRETEKALGESAPQVFFTVLKNCGALRVLFPELYYLYGIPNPPKHHPEVDTGIHTMMVLEQSARLSSNPRVRFAALLHDLGKANTPKDLLPRHHGHEQRSVKLVNKLCERFKIPKNYQKLAVKVAEFHGVCHRAFELRADTIARLLKQLDAFRNPDDFYDFLLACTADSRGRTGFEDCEYKQADYLSACFQAARNIKSTPYIEAGYEGQDLAKAMYQAQIEAIEVIKVNFTNN